MNSWTKAEDSIIIEFYKDKTVNILEKLPGRSKEAINQRAQVLGISDEYIPWTEEELNLIRTYYPTMGKKMMSMLPNRSLKNIQVTAFRLGVKRIRRCR